MFPRNQALRRGRASVMKHPAMSDLQMSIQHKRQRGRDLFAYVGVEPGEDKG
jgi:hypothetical protein